MSTQEADLLDTVGGMKGFAHASTLRVQTSWVSQPIDDLVLSDKRLLLIRRDTVKKAFVFDPATLLQAGNRRSNSFPLAAVSPKRHLFRPMRRSTFWLLALLFLVTGIISGSARSWPWYLLGVIVVGSFALRARPWMGVRLHHIKLPKVLSLISSSSDFEIMLRDQQAVPEFLRLLAERTESL
jgi:hypothetical protein